MSNSAMKCLFHPFETGLIAAPCADDSVVFLCAREGGYARDLPARSVFQQHYKPEFDRLKKVSRNVFPDTGKIQADYTLLLAPKQLQELKYRIAAGVQTSTDGSIFMCAAANDAGGNRLVKLFEKLGLKTQSESKYKAKVVWTVVRHNELDENRLKEFLAHGELRRSAHGFISCPGLFSWDKIDRGSQMLAKHLPRKMTGFGADFGCGYGYLSREILENHNGCTGLLCIDADYRALEACRANMDDYRVPKEYHWEDLSTETPPMTGLDWVVMNPPFHEARQTSVKTGQAFIRTAGLSLRDGGELWMVANSHLPYESVLNRCFQSFSNLGEEAGFKVIRAVK